MIPKIEKVAVLGAGTMGAQIAGHFANVGVPVLLLDLRSETGDPSSVARTAVDKLGKIKPAPLFLPEKSKLIEVGNFEDDLPRLSECDWILEAIVEKLEVKRRLWKSVLPFLRSEAIVSSNTSGLPLARIAEGFPEDFRRRWLGTHFFNPPRYMRLLELIPGPETEPKIMTKVAALGDQLLGKGIVVAKDRPNFVANRIGVFVGGLGMRLRSRLGLSIEEVDALTGPLIGRPKTATFSLSDLVGNDVMAQVGLNLVEALPDDPWRDLFAPDPLLLKVVERGWTGRKTGQGFYKKQGREILVLDFSTLEYRSQQAVNIPSLSEVRKEPNSARRISKLIEADDAAGHYLWPYLRDTFAYAAGRVPEICDEFYQIDRAMRWGFGWEQGPFELWQQLGTGRIVERAVRDGVEFPGWIDDVLSEPSKSFYQETKEVLYFDLASRGYQVLPLSPEKIQLRLIKSSRGEVVKNDAASLIDLGDGVACLEFHSKMNSIDARIVELAGKALTQVEKDFLGLVIGNQAQDFSVGANLVFLLEAAEAGRWEEIDQAVRAFQDMNVAFRRFSKPVVAAPFGRTLAGGAEVCLGCDALVAGAETYMGLVEVGVGLIPAGGGTTELLIRQTAENGLDLAADRTSGLKRAFEIIGMAKVSSSAAEALQMRLLRNRDEIEIQSERLLHRAKQKVLSLSESGYRPELSSRPVVAVGNAGLALLKVGLHVMEKAAFITPYDAHIGRKLAFVLTGGDLNHPSVVPEERLLELEREAFVSLCGEEKTRARIAHMLREGKPLRN